MARRGHIVTCEPAAGLVIVIASIALMVAAVPLTGGKLRSLAHLRLRFVWIVWVCLALQVATGVVASALDSGAAASWLHVATFGPAGVFVWANRHVPGAVILAIGGGTNLVAIASNGGVMPARPAAWSGAGLPDVSDEAFANSMPTTDAPLWFLGDVFFVPAGWPFANVFSIGDVLLVGGAGFLVHAWCRRPLHTIERAETLGAAEPTTRTSGPAVADPLVEF